MEMRYSYTSVMEDVSTAFAIVNGEQTVGIQIKQNRFDMPAAGNGSFLFYELEPGLAVFFADYSFAEEFKIVRKPKKTNEYYGLHINLTTTPVIANEQSGKVVDIGSDWSNAILFSSSTKGIQKIIPAGTRFIEATLIMDYFWFKKQYQDAHVPEAMTQLWELKADMPLQLTMDLTLPMLSIVEDMMAISLPEYLKATYYTGECKKLLSLFLLELTIKPSRRRKEILKLSEVEDIMQLKEELEKKVVNEMPAAQEYSDRLKMSKTKFNTLFRHVYGKTFAEVIMEIKMQQASELLIKGVPCTEVAAMIGYKNASNFARVFREYFKTTPKIYQSSEQRKLRIEIKA